MHLSDAGHERGKRPHDRHKASQNDRLAAVAVVEGLRLLQMLVLQKPGIEREGPGADPPPQKIIDRVPQDRGDREEDKERHETEIVRIERRHGAGGEEERIARQEGHDDEARLAEDDREQKDVDPRPPGFEEGMEMVVDVEKDVENRLDRVHSRWFSSYRDDTHQPGPGFFFFQVFFLGKGFFPHGARGGPSPPPATGPNFRTGFPGGRGPSSPPAYPPAGGPSPPRGG